MKVLILLATLVVSSTTAIAAESPEYRLPADIQPVSQGIKLELDPARTEFSGQTAISLNITAATDRIGINQIGLNMTRISLTSSTDERVLTASDGEWENSWLSDGSSIEPGKYVLAIDFTGTFPTDSLGMHRVSFEDNDYIFTQMEAMYARRAFPVFDEPSFKIPYQLTIYAPSEHAVIANTPVESTTEEDGWQRVEFMPTQPMSSYLLAYAVGPLDRAEIKGMSVSGYVYTPKGHADELGFVLRETPVIVRTLEEYFGSQYPYRKLDFVAVPEFAFGAMENPGLITYRTDLLMVGDDVSGGQAEAVVNVIAHEVAHIWYGDLVTMAWWDDLWLNEAFASWMARTVLERAYPELESGLKLPQENAFAVDQRTTSKAIRRTVRNNDEIFDGIGLNYTKGHALLKMLETYVGADVWQAAIQKYVEKFAWTNATEQDLWAVVASESGQDIASIASDYLNQPGFPTVSVSRDGEISQRRYLTEGRTAEDLQWRIPMNVKYKSEGEIRETFALLDTRTGALDVPESTDWIFPDAGGNGYYRWATDMDQFYNLIDDVDSLSEREKVALIDNSEALLNAASLSIGDYLFVIERLLQDQHPLVFLTALEKLKVIAEEFIDDGNRALFTEFVDATLTDRFQEVGAESRPDDSDALRQMRPRLLRVLGQSGADEAVREVARDLTDAYFDSADEVQSGLALEAMRVTALVDDGQRYEAYVAAYLDSESPDQQSNILSAVYFTDPDVVRSHMDFSISKEVSAGNALMGLSTFGYLLQDHSIIYEWMGTHVDELEAKIPEYYHAVLPQVIGANCSADNLVMLDEFFADRGDKYASALAKAREEAEACIQRRERHATDLLKFLQQNSAS